MWRFTSRDSRGEWWFQPRNKRKWALYQENRIEIEENNNKMEVEAIENENGEGETWHT